MKGITEQTAISAVTQNMNIAEAMKTNLVNGILTKGRTMYNYGKRNELDPSVGYYLGLPQGTKAFIPIGREDTVKRIIERDSGELITLVSMIVDKEHATHYAQEYMQSNYGWDSNTDIVSNPPFNPNGQQVTFVDALVKTTNQIKIVYAYGSSFHEELLTVTDLVLKELYYYATYYTVDNQGNTVGDLKYWRYRENLGTHSELDIEGSAEVQVSPYYPIVPLREDSVNVNAEAYQNTSEYKSRKQCLNYLGLKIDQISDGIHESPDIDDVDHAYVMIGVDIASDKENSIKYLFEFFANQYLTSNYDESDMEYWEKHGKSRGLTPPTNLLTIEDAKYKMELTWDYIKKETFTGSIGTIGTVERTISVGTGMQDHGWYSLPTGAVAFRKQVTADKYIQYTIQGLVHTNYVYGDHVVKTTLFKAFEEENKEYNFVIPLDVNLTRNIGIINAHDLMYDAVRIVFNSRIRTKLKWYQTSAFRIIMFIIVVVYTFYTQDYQTGMRLMAIATGLATTAITLYIQSLVIGQIIKLAADVFGEELALLLTIAFIAMGGEFTETGGLEFATSITADNLYLALTHGLPKAMQIYTNNTIEGIQKEMDALDKEKEEFEEAFNTGLDDPLNVLGLGSDYTFTYDVVKDSPSYYYTRTIHLGNISSLVLSAHEYYVDGQLKLDLPYNPIRTRVY